MLILVQKYLHAAEFRVVQFNNGTAEHLLLMLNLMCRCLAKRGGGGGRRRSDLTSQPRRRTAEIHWIHWTGAT